MRSQNGHIEVVQGLCPPIVILTPQFLMRFRPFLHRFLLEAWNLKSHYFWFLMYGLRASGEVHPSLGLSSPLNMPSFRLLNYGIAVINSLTPGQYLLAVSDFRKIEDGEVLLSFLLSVDIGED